MSKIHTKPTLAFYMGYSESFNGKNYNSKNVFGSEINAIKLAESLSHLYNIIIFVNIEEKDELKGDTKIQKTTTTTTETTLEEFKSINKNTEKIEENDSTDDKQSGSLIPPWFR